MMNKRTIIFSVTVSLLFALALFLFPAVKGGARADTTSNELRGWGWSSNVGWISFNHADLSGSTSNYAVILQDNVSDTTQKDLVGYAWSSSLGWIRFLPALSGPSGQGDNFGAKIVGNRLLGWARACSVVDRTKSANCDFGTNDANLLSDSSLGSWDGWIKMSNISYNSSTGEFSGYAWGSLNLGWMTFGVNSSGQCPVPLVNGCCPAWGVCGGPGGGPTVTCQADPSKGDTSSTITWYTSSVSGFSKEAKDLTYSWSDTAGNNGSGNWNESTGRDEFAFGPYPVGQAKATITATDGSLSAVGSCTVDISLACVSAGGKITVAGQYCCDNPNQDPLPAVGDVCPDLNPCVGAVSYGEYNNLDLNGEGASPNSPNLSNNSADIRFSGGCDAGKELVFESGLPAGGEITLLCSNDTSSKINGSSCSLSGAQTISAQTIGLDVLSQFLIVTTKIRKIEDGSTEPGPNIYINYYEPSHG